MADGEQAPSAHLAAAALLIIKALLGLWAAIVLLTASATRPHTFLGQAVSRRVRGAGLLALLLVVATVVIAVALSMGRPWGPPAAYVLEGLAVVLALTRIVTRPRAAILSLVLSALVVGLVASGSRSRPNAPTTG